MMAVPVEPFPRGGGAHVPPRWQEAAEAGDLDACLRDVACGDVGAYERLYDELAPVVYGISRSVVRDPLLSEEVTQEVLLEVWRMAARYDPRKGTVQAWVATIAHRRAVDRVRTEQRAAERSWRAAPQINHQEDVVGAVETRLDHERVRRCLDVLTDLQRQSVMLAYYGGHTYREVAALLGVALGTVNTRMRDGLIRLRDCMGVEL